MAESEKTPERAISDLQTTRLAGASVKDSSITDNSSSPFQIDRKEQERLKSMGLKTALAIALHNFPEGLATFVSTLESIELGVSMMIGIAIHNIPEGLCVSVPYYYATGD